MFEPLEIYENRSVEFPGRRKMQILDANGDVLEEKTVRILRDEGEVYDEGTPLNAETMNRQFLSLVTFLAGHEIVQYACNGVNDNEVLSQMSKDFYNDLDLSDTLNRVVLISGQFGWTENPIVGDGTSSNTAKFFDFGIADYNGNRKLTLDFSEATIPAMTFTKYMPEQSFSLDIFYNQGSYLKIVGLDLHFTTKYGADNLHMRVCVLAGKNLNIYDSKITSFAAMIWVYASFEHSLVNSDYSYFENVTFISTNSGQADAIGNEGEFNEFNNSKIEISICPARGFINCYVAKGKNCRFIQTQLIGSCNYPEQMPSEISNCVTSGLTGDDCFADRCLIQVSIRFLSGQLHAIGVSGKNVNMINSTIESEITGKVAYVYGVHGETVTITGCTISALRSVDSDSYSGSLARAVGCSSNATSVCNVENCNIPAISKPNYRQDHSIYLEGTTSGAKYRIVNNTLFAAPVLHSATGADYIYRDNTITGNS